LESGAVSWLAGFDATQPLWWFGDAVVDRGDAEQSARVEDGSDRLRRGHIDRPTRLRVSAHLGGVLTLVRADRQVFHHGRLGEEQLRAAVDHPTVVQCRLGKTLLRRCGWVVNAWNVA
jgi:hypothetical protein